MFEGKPKATKAYLKGIKLMKEELLRMIESDTRPKLKRKNEPLGPDEVPIGRYPNIVEVPVTEEDRKLYRQRLKEVEEEEKRVEAELSAKKSSQKLPTKKKKGTAAK